MKLFEAPNGSGASLGPRVTESVLRAEGRFEQGAIETLARVAFFGEAVKRGGVHAVHRCLEKAQGDEADNGSSTDDKHQHEGVRSDGANEEHGADHDQAERQQTTRAADA